MSEFGVYLQWGFTHIADLAAYDHMLFLLMLCAVYRLRDWKQVALMVSAFTIGHSLTLAMAVTGVWLLNPVITEFLIPLTILLTALYQVWKPERPLRFHAGLYAMVLLFGLIHGMGFSGLLRMLLMTDEGLAMPLFAFNLGIELGQLLIVTIFLGIATLCTTYLNVKRRDYVLFVSGGGAFMALMLMQEHWPL